jgi:hypothetical protein
MIPRWVGRIGGTGWRYSNCPRFLLPLRAPESGEVMQRGGRTDAAGWGTGKMVESPPAQQVTVRRLRRQVTVRRLRRQASARQGRFSAWTIESTEKGFGKAGPPETR